MPTSIATPKDVTLNIEKHFETTINGTLEHIIYVNGQEYKELPLDANVREPDRKKSRPYSSMMETLKSEPHKFFDYNLGISVIATTVSVSSSGKKVTMHFDSGTGILNGGHTQCAILDSKSDPNISKAIIRLIVKEHNYANKEMAAMAAAQNNSTQVKEYSIAEKLGYFVDIKKLLDENLEKHIVWYEGRNVPNDAGLTPTNLISLLNMFNIHNYLSNYKPTSNSQPNNSANAESTVFSKWENSTGDALTNYKDIYPLINDILLFYEHMQLHFADYGSNFRRLAIIQDNKKKAPTTIFTNQKCPDYVPKQMLMPLLAAFRANVFYDHENKIIGWYEDNVLLMKRYYKDLASKLKTSYAANGNQVNRLTKDVAIWENLYNTLNSRIDKSKRFKEYCIK